MQNSDIIARVLLIFLLSAVRSSHQTTYTCNPSVSCGCSTNSATLARIVDGEIASPATWGWAVSMSVANRYQCVGSIISSSWIVTAAHCVYGYTASQITIYAGSINQLTGTQIRAVSQIIVHPNYNEEELLEDIALLRLASPLSMTDSNVSQICLPSVNDTILTASEWPPFGTTVVAIGWGRSSWFGPESKILQQVTLQIINYNSTVCSTFNDWYTQLCAGVPGTGKGTCKGDSGGPLMMFTSSNQWMLVGVTSKGWLCDLAKHAGTYTRVTAYINWINACMNSPPPTTLFPPIISHGNILAISIFSVFAIVLFNLSIACFY